MNVYCDMDGVLVDFVGGYKALTGYHIEHYAYIHGWDEAWKQISHYGEYRFWRNLEFTKWGQELWNSIKCYNPAILTSPGRDIKGEAALAKRDWVNSNLDKETVVICADDKYKYAGDSSILIDDSFEKRLQFLSYGGYSIDVHDLMSAREVTFIFNLLGVAYAKWDKE